MKKSIILLTFLLMFIGKSNAQNWNLNGNVLGTPPPPYIVGGLSGAYDIFFYANGNQYMDLQYSTGALGIGLSYAPSYQLDVQCNSSLPSLKDINVSTNTGPQNVGYRIGGNYVLWHNGITSNIFVGVNAGNATGTGQANTFVGYNAGNSFGAAANNTAIGEDALLLNQTGLGNTAAGSGSLQNNLASYNTAVGGGALFANNLLAGNIAIGDSALFNLAGIISFNSGDVAVGNSTLFANAGSFNTAIGEWAMRYTSANSCVATGYAALYSNTTGAVNTANGYEAMFSNTMGVENAAVGALALYSNTSGSDNTALGEFALNLNTIGQNNTATGNAALQGNTTGYYNTATGENALAFIATGSSNTAIGNRAGYNNAESWNTFLGDSAGVYNTTGTYNTFIGYQAGSTTAAATYTNTTCLGYQAETYTTVPDNSINLGNGSITHICAAGAYGITAYSDRRIKDNIQENVPGLAFISKLHSVTYNIDLHKENELLGIKDNTDWPGKYDIEKITQSGFVAQQVDSAAQACGYNFNGLNRPTTSDGLYSLNYTAFIMPLVKAVQELSTKNDSLNAKNNSLTSTVDSLRGAFNNMQTCLNRICAATGNSDINSISATEQNITLSSAGAPLLYQNMPNPFATGTKINYYLPQGTVGGTIVFYDMYGNQIKIVSLSQTGNGTLNITPDNLSNGIYSYSLIVSGNVIDTKKMVLQK